MGAGTHEDMAATRSETDRKKRSRDLDEAVNQDDAFHLQQHESDLALLEAESIRLKDAEVEVNKEYNRKKNELAEANEKNRMDIEEKRKWVYLEKWCLLLRQQNKQQCGSIVEAAPDVAPGTRDSDSHLWLLSKNCAMIPMGYGKTLGDALLECKDAPTKLLLSLTLVLNLLLLPSSIGHGENAETIVQRAASDYLQPLHQHLKTSHALHQVTLCYSSDPYFWRFKREGGNNVSDEEDDALHAALLGSFLQSMSQNPGIANAVIACPTNASHLSYCGSFRTLSVDIGSFFRDSQIDEQDAFASSIQSLSALKSLSITGIEDYQQYLVVSILRSIQTGGVALQELCFMAVQGPNHRGTPPDFWEALAQMVAATPTLHLLELSKFYLRREDMQGLIRCLQCPDSASTLSTTISKLSFSGSTFHDYTILPFIEFLKTNTEPYYELAYQQSTLLREVCGLPSHYRIPEMLALLPPNDSASGSLRATIGSALQTLALNDFSHFSLCHFTRFADRICLPCLHIKVINEGGARSLLDFVPMLWFLRELHISELGGYARDQVEVPKHLVTMTRQSASLYICVYPPIFDTAQQRQIHAYLERNKFFVQLAKQEPRTEGAGGPNKPNPMLVPALLLVAVRLSRRMMFCAVGAIDMTDTID